jgi:ArsR family transcriptional regulator
MPQLIATLRDVTEGRRADGSAACGSLTTDEAMPRDQAEATAALLKAVADPVRLQLLSLIRSSKGQEACVCDLTPAVGLSQPTVSHHLKVLTEAGLVTRERRGTWAWFQLVPARLDDLAAIFR